MDNLTDAQFNGLDKSHHWSPNLDPAHRQAVATERFRRRRAEKAEMLRTQVSRITNTFSYTTSKETALDQETASTRPANLQSYQEQLLAPVSDNTTNQMYPSTYPRPIELTLEQIEQQTQAVREYKQSLMPGHDPDSKESNEAYSKALQEYQTSLMVLECGKHNTERLRMRRSDSSDSLDCEYHDSETGKDVLQDFDFDSFLQNGHQHSPHVAQSSTSDAQQHPSRKEGIEKPSEIGTYGWMRDGIWYGDTGTADPVTGLDVLVEFDFDAFLRQDGSDAGKAFNYDACVLESGPKAGQPSTESTGKIVNMYQKNRKPCENRNPYHDYDCGCIFSIEESISNECNFNMVNDVQGGFKANTMEAEGLKYVTQEHYQDERNINMVHGTSSGDNKYTMEEELLKYVKQEEEERFRCQAEGCTKLFKAQHFWEKHIKNRHSEWFEDKQKEIDLMNTMLEPKEPGSMSLDTLPVDRPLFINPKQFDRILKRRQTKHQIESLEQQKKVKREQSAPSECAEVPSSSQTTGSIDVPAPSLRSISLPSRPKHSTQSNARKNEAEPDCGDLAPSVAQSSRLWWQAWNSLNSSTFGSTAFSTINFTIWSELQILLLNNPSDEILSQKISQRLAHINAIPWDENPRISAILKTRQNILNVLSVVEGFLGLEASALAWGCVLTILSLHEQTLAYPIIQERAQFARSLYTSLAQLETVVEIIARYAALERDYQQGSIPLDPESRLATISLFSTILEYFALMMMEAKDLIAMITSRIPDLSEWVQQLLTMDTMMATIKRKDETCQVFRDAIKTNNQNTFEDSESKAEAESGGDEDWEMVEKDDVDNIAQHL